MVIVTLAQVQQWLERTKMLLATVDPDLAESARLVVFAKVEGAYDTATWDANTTPKLIKTLVSKLIAAWEYLRAYGEEEDSTYGRRLERQVYDLLDEIANGSTALEEYPDVFGQMGTPTFHPSDESSAAEVYDAVGNYVAANDDVRFRMAGRY